MYTVGLTYNLKKGAVSIEDEEAEFDDFSTVEAIKAAIEDLGCNVVLLEATSEIITEIPKHKIDIVFNFAEGLRGRGREAQVPALLNLLKIPFTGSDETTLGVALDKALAKKIVAFSRVKTPKFQVFFTKNDRLRKHLKFPLMVKPNAEGSSKGIIDKAKVQNLSDLKQSVSNIIDVYKQPALVEEYIEGREFTVGLLGNDDALEVLPILEAKFHDASTHGFYSYRVKKHCNEYATYECPAKLPDETAKKIRKMAVKVYNALECKDVSRIDIRYSTIENEPYFIEINPLPGLEPGFSDLPTAAQAAGISYPELIKKILNASLIRYDMQPL